MKLVFIKLFVNGVLALEFRNQGLHFFHHLGDLHGNRHFVETVDARGYLGICIFADTGHVDLRMGSFLCVFLVAQHFFVELFTRTKTGVLDADVLVRTEAREDNHAAGQIGNLHGFTHVEHKDFATIAHGSGLEYQATGFGDGHEETDDVGMGHRYRTTVLDLFLETRDNGTVAAQHVAEAGGDELGLAGYLALAERHAQALYIDFRQTLAATHDVGGVHGLVGRNHHKAFYFVLHRHIRHVATTEYIHTDGLARIFFHQGHMLVGGCMEYHLRTIGTEYVFQTGTATHVANDGQEAQVRELLFQFQAKVVHRGLAHVVAHQPFDVEFGQLAADFATDTTSSTGHQHGLAPQQSGYFVQVDFNLVTSQQVLDMDTTDGTGNDTVLHLFGTRNDQGTEVDGIAHRYQAVLFFLGQLHVREENTVDVMANDQLLQLFFVLYPKHGIT